MPRHNAVNADRFSTEFSTVVCGNLSAANRGPDLKAESLSMSTHNCNHRRPARNHPAERSARRSRRSDHSVHRRRRHRARHLARERARVRRRRREGVRRQAQDRVDGGSRRREGFKNSHGNWLPDDTVDAFRQYHVGIKGPLTTPVGGGIRSLNVTLRQVLDLYVCLRPVRYFKGVPSPVKHPEKVDMVIFRENTEDIYAGIEYAEGTPRGRAGSIEFLGRRTMGKRIAAATRGIGIKPMSRDRHRSGWCTARSSTRSRTSARASRSCTRATS